VRGRGKRGDKPARFARSLRTDVPGLIAMCMRPGRRFERRLSKAMARAGIRAFADVTTADMACEVVRIYVADEAARQICEIADASVPGFSVAFPPL
jgi:hypothetical protein